MVQHSEEVELATRMPLPTSTRSLDSANRARRSMQEQEQGNIDGTLSMSSTPGQGTELHPVDTGKHAWLFLAAATSIGSVVWGIPNSYGVFLNAYLNDPSYTQQKYASNILPLIGPMSSGIMYCSGIVVFPCLSRYPQHMRKIIAAGTFLCIFSLLAAGFVSQIYALLALQGILFSLGGSMLYAPCIRYMTQWFVKRRGLANGIIFSGTGVGGLVFPILLSHLLTHRSPSDTLKILTIPVSLILLLSLPFIRGRLPDMRVAGPAPGGSWLGFDKSWLRSRVFWMAIAVNTLQGFGYFVPLLWLPNFATALNLGAVKSSIILAVINAATCIGRTSIGVLSDHVSPWPLALSTLTLTSISNFVLWGVVSHTYGGLIVFGVAYGLFAGGWSSTWTGFIKPVAKDDPILVTAFFSYLQCTRGIGNILSTPISTALAPSSPRPRSSSHLQISLNSSHPIYHAGLTHNHEVQVGAIWKDGKNLGFNVGAGGFQAMILYVGCCFASGAVVSLLGWVIEALEAKRRRDAGRLNA